MTDLTKKVFELCEKENASIAEVREMVNDLQWEFSIISKKIETEIKFTQA